MLTYRGKKYVCHLDLGMSLVKGKWKAVILCHLNKGPKRFLELHRITCGISQKVLMNQLQELEEDGLIHKAVLSEKPPHVEYTMSDKGKTLYPAIELLESWSLEEFKELKHSR